jgi:ATP-dependent Zn protease
LSGFSSEVKGTKSDKLVYYNENTQLNDVIKTKDALINEQGNHRVELVGLDKVVKDNSTTINIKNTKSTNGKMKFILPVLFVLIFIMIRFFIAFYKKQSLKEQHVKA